MQMKTFWMAVDDGGFECLWPDNQGRHQARVAGENAETAGSIHADERRYSVDLLGVGSILQAQAEGIQDAAFDIEPRM